MKARIWTVPNQITLLRLGILPFFLILVLYEKYQWAIVVLVFVALTDTIDGYLARTLHQKSALGAYLDPIADKLLLSSAFFVLAMEKKIAWWLTILVLSRDILMLVVAAVILLILGYRPFPPTLLGKSTTFFEIAQVFFTVLAPRIPATVWTRWRITWFTQSPPWSSSLAFTTASLSPAACTSRNNLRLFHVELFLQFLGQRVSVVQKHHRETGRDNESRGPAKGVSSCALWSRLGRSIGKDSSEEEPCRQTSGVRPVIRAQPAEQQTHRKDGDDPGNQAGTQFAHLHPAALRSDGNQQSDQPKDRAARADRKVPSETAHRKTGYGHNHIQEQIPCRSVDFFHNRPQVQKHHHIESNVNQTTVQKRGGYESKPLMVRKSEPSHARP